MLGHIVQVKEKMKRWKVVDQRRKLKFLQTMLAFFSDLKSPRLKFLFSKKVTKFDEIFTVHLKLWCSQCQIDGKDLVNFCGLLRKQKLYHRDHPYITSAHFCTFLTHPPYVSIERQQKWPFLLTPPTQSTISNPVPISTWKYYLVNDWFEMSDTS